MTPVEQIKSRLSVVDVVSSYLKLTRAGSNFKAPCPFHSEKSPSFFVSPTRDVWHCFGCGVGGDQFRFVMQIEGVDFREALKILADRAGIELRPEKPEERNERTRLFNLLEVAVQFYQQELKRYPAVEAYLVGRGVTSESMQKFRIGYAPPETVGWRAFTEHALKKKYTLAELEKVGLSIRKQSNSDVSTINYSLQTNHYYDRFRNRVMFPITDANAHVVGFGGRIFPSESNTASTRDSSDQAPAKYINSPQTALYDKSAVLYAFDKAKMAIRKENSCVVVEGYMDAIMAHQAGTEHVVAVSGTVLTDRQLVAVRRLCDKISMSFDMDAAGEMATRRSIDLALGMGFDVRAITLPSGKDPADLAAKDPAVWRQAVDGATDVITFFLTKALQRYDSHTLEGKRGIIASVLPLVARLPREVDKAHWVSHVASRIGVREDAVWQDLGKESRNPQSRVDAPANENRTTRPVLPKERTRERILEERITGLLCTYGLARFPVVTEDLFSSEDIKTLYHALAGSQDTRSALANVPQEHLRTLANQLIFETEVLVNEDGAEAECTSCVMELQKERLKEKLEQLTRDIRVAEEAGNEQQVGMLVGEFGEVSKSLFKI